MFDFFKKEADEDLIKKACKETGNEELMKEPEFKKYMQLMMEGYDKPGEITQVCAMVIVVLAKYHELPKPSFKELLQAMEHAFDTLPSKELMQSMMEFDLI